MPYNNTEELHAHADHCDDCAHVGPCPPLAAVVSEELRAARAAALPLPLLTRNAEIGCWETRLEPDGKQYEYRYTCHVIANDVDPKKPSRIEVVWAGWALYSGSHSRTEGVEKGVERQAIMEATRAKAQYEQAIRPHYGNSGKV